MNKLKMIEFNNRKCFMPEKAIELPHLKLEIWPGYVTSVREHEGGLFLECDVSHKVLRAETAYEVISAIALNR